MALTQTINTAFGSKVMIPGTGVLLNDQMDDFSVQPGAPNAFKLIGGEANAVSPGKRPLSSMSPTIVLKDGLQVLMSASVEDMEKKMSDYKTKNEALSKEVDDLSAQVVTESDNGRSPDSALQFLAGVDGRDVERRGNPLAVFVVLDADGSGRQSRYGSRRLD